MLLDYAVGVFAKSTVCVQDNKKAEPKAVSDTKAAPDPLIRSTAGPLSWYCDPLDCNLDNSYLQQLGSFGTWHLHRLTESPHHEARGERSAGPKSRGLVALRPGRGELRGSRRGMIAHCSF